MALGFSTPHWLKETHEEVQRVEIQLCSQSIFICLSAPRVESLSTPSDHWEGGGRAGGQTDGDLSSSPRTSQRATKLPLCYCPCLFFVVLKESYISVMNPAIPARGKSIGQLHWPRSSKLERAVWIDQRLYLKDDRSAPRGRGNCINRLD